MKKKWLFFQIIFDMNQENLVSQSFVKAKDAEKAGSRTLPAYVPVFYFEPRDL